MSYIRRRTVEGLKKGDTFTVSRVFSEEDVFRFAGISRDYNPVHFEERFAHAKNFTSPICHGLLVGSLLTEIGGQIGMLASGMYFDFKSPVYFGERIECRFTISEIDARGRAKADVVFRNEAGTVVIEATVTGVVPGPKEIEILETMLAEGDPANKLNQ